jgi:hypothetical protein
LDWMLWAAHRPIATRWIDLLIRDEGGEPKGSFRLFESAQTSLLHAYKEKGNTRREPIVYNNQKYVASRDQITHTHDEIIAHTRCPEIVRGCVFPYRVREEEIIRFIIHGRAITRRHGETLACMV